MTKGIFLGLSPESSQLSHWGHGKPPPRGFCSDPASALFWVLTACVVEEDLVIEAQAQLRHA